MRGAGTASASRRRGKVLLAALLLQAAALAAEAEVAVPPPGAASCLGCHAARPGVETPVPRLAGQSATAITTALAAYRSGERSGSGTIMNRIAKGFSPEESAAIAAWFAARKE